MRRFIRKVSRVEKGRGIKIPTSPEGQEVNLPENNHEKSTKKVRQLPKSKPPSSSFRPMTPGQLVNRHVRRQSFDLSRVDGEGMNPFFQKQTEKLVSEMNGLPPLSPRIEPTLSEKKVSGFSIDQMKNERRNFMTPQGAMSLRLPNKGTHPFTPEVSQSTRSIIMEGKNPPKKVEEGGGMDPFLEKLSPMKRRMYLFSRSTMTKEEKVSFRGGYLSESSTSKKSSFNKTYDAGIVLSLQKFNQRVVNSSKSKWKRKNIKGSKSLSLNKYYVSRILKFFSEQELIRHEINDYDFLTKYPVNNMDVIVKCKKMLKQRKKFSVEMTKKIVPMLFIEENLAFSMISHISNYVGSRKEQEKEFKFLLEILILPTSEFFLLSKKKKCKFIQAKGKDIRNFVRKYKKILILEPSLFIKVIKFIPFEEIETHLFSSSDVQKKVSLSFADVLYILKIVDNQKIRDFALETLKYRYSDDQLFVLVKPLVHLLKEELGGIKDINNSAMNINGSGCCLARFFCYLSQRTSLLWSYVNWELVVESEFKAPFLEDFRRKFILGGNNNLIYSSILERQQKLSEFVMEIQEKIEQVKEKRRKKLVVLRRLLIDDEKRICDIFNSKDIIEEKNPSANSYNFFLPSHETKITGISPNECFIWKSAKLPIKLAFKTAPIAPKGSITNEEGEECLDEDYVDLDKKELAVLFKKGDDLRQDQLILNVISFMNVLLLKHELDLRIIIYQIMCTAKLNGLIEIVPNSFNMTEIFERFESIGTFLRIFNPSVDEYNQAVNTFARSLAGYTVMTYLLGIGDRHLENMMITTGGNFFHVDFSFIFGEDPKFKTPVRITTEMIDVLGGINGTAFYEFSVYLCKAYNQLRYHHNIIISLLYSMTNSKIPHVTVENIKKTVSRFELEKTDKEARVHILGVVLNSLKSIVPKINELFHKIAQNLRD